MVNKNNIERAFTVVVVMETPDGGCPSLPDSTYLTKEDAQQRIDECFNYCWRRTILL